MLHPTYAEDKSLDVIVVAPLPSLQIDFSSLPTSMLAGEMQTLSVQLRNPSPLAISNLRVLCDKPNFAFICANEAVSASSSTSKQSSVMVSSKISNQPTQTLTSTGELSQSSSLAVQLHLRADAVGTADVGFLFVFTSSVSFIGLIACSDLIQSISCRATRTRRFSVLDALTASP